MSKRSRRAIVWAALGFLVFGLYVIIRDAIEPGAGSLRIGYWVGTFIGSGVVGAIIGGLAGYFTLKRSH
jgi:nitric oxide reductase large subunit